LQAYRRPADLFRSSRRTRVRKPEARLGTFVCWVYTILPTFFFRPPCFLLASSFSENRKPPSVQEACGFNFLSFYVGEWGVLYPFFLVAFLQYAADLFCVISKTQFVFFGPPPLPLLRVVSKDSSLPVGLEDLHSYHAALLHTRARKCFLSPLRPSAAISRKLLVLVWFAPVFPRLWHYPDQTRFCASPTPNDFHFCRALRKCGRAEYPRLSAIRHVLLVDQTVEGTSFFPKVCDLVAFPCFAPRLVRASFPSLLQTATFEGPDGRSPVCFFFFFLRVFMRGEKNASFGF